MADQVQPKQKDYFNLAKRNFRILGIIGILFGFGFVAVKASLFATTLIFASGIAYIVISVGLGKRTSWSISAGFIFVGLNLLLTLVNGLRGETFGPALVGIILDVVINLYLLNQLRQAKKSQYSPS